ncbi:rod shape-determining protein [Leptolyngbya sp. 7M]|uniref:rod shape-determining protein n=1 Tax=Leptolyngbya sp. 7M TaxID=2812896 RepID=UPI001B8AD451|nr:rod shape-determining protein [Leptolyngbya sp. 7M]QYO66933.1 rod shape-determining protein [Leptolyngbya sp. 7M]
MLKISSLKKLVTDSMAIDLGTASTIIAVKDRGIVLDEPSLVAINELNEEIVAFGQEAAEMSGREGRDVIVKAPLIGGVVADFERTKKMLAHFVKKARSGGSNIAIQAVMSMVSDVTHVEQRALLNAAEDAGIGKVFMMEEGLAAAFGAGILPTDKRASAIVDIGAGTTNIAIIAKGSIVHSTSERFGSNEINDVIATHLRRHRGLQVGEETTEFLKTNFVSTYLPDDISRTIEVRGRDVQTGSPAAVEITTGELYPIVEGIVRRIAQLVKDTLTELRPEVAADIYDRGVILAGGGAMLDGRHCGRILQMGICDRGGGSRDGDKPVRSTRCRICKDRSPKDN